MGKNSLAASGTLAATPLVELLAHALSRQLGGTLVFEAPDGAKSALSLSDGVVMKSRLAVPVHRLGEVCVGLDLLSSADVKRALARTDDTLLGQRLMEQGMTREQLDEALTSQLLLHVQTIAELPGLTVYGYYPGDDLLEQWGGASRQLDPLRTLWCSARSADSDKVARIIKRVRALPELRLHRQSRVGRFGFSKNELSVLDVLRAKPRSYAQLQKAGLIEARLLERVVYVLAVSRHLDLGGGFPLAVSSEARVEERVSDVGRRTPVVANPRPLGSPDAPDERRVELQRMLERVDEADYYELLGVPQDVDASTLQAAFLQLARKWHPDKLPPALSDCRGDVTRVFARMTEAHKVLTNAQQRADYDRLRQEGAEAEEDQAKVRAVLRAMTAFQKAEVLLRRGDIAGVEKLAKEAHTDDPEQAEYGALYAFAMVKGRKMLPTSEQKRLTQLLDEAVEREPHNLRIRAHRARALQLLGRETDAMRDFRAIVEAEPSNVDAQRELRLFKMRREEQSEPPNQGLLGKLLGKG